LFYTTRPLGGNHQAPKPGSSGSSVDLQTSPFSFFLHPQMPSTPLKRSAIKSTSPGSRRLRAEQLPHVAVTASGHPCLNHSAGSLEPASMDFAYYVRRRGERRQRIVKLASLKAPSRTRLQCPRLCSPVLLGMPLGLDTASGALTGPAAPSSVKLQPCR